MINVHEIHAKYIYKYNTKLRLNIYKFNNNVYKDMLNYRLK